MAQHVFSLIFHCLGISPEQSTYPSTLCSRQHLNKLPQAPNFLKTCTKRAHISQKSIWEKLVCSGKKQGEICACCRNTKQDLVKICVDTQQVLISAEVKC